MSASSPMVLGVLWGGLLAVVPVIGGVALRTPVPHRITVCAWIRQIVISPES